MTVEKLSSEVGTNASTISQNVPWSCTVTVTEAADQWLERAHERSKVLESVLSKLRNKEIPGKEYVEEYLRDQYRRHCRPNTL